MDKALAKNLPYSQVKPPISTKTMSFIHYHKVRSGMNAFISEEPSTDTVDASLGELSADDGSDPGDCGWLSVWCL